MTTTDQPRRNQPPPKRRSTRWFEREKDRSARVRIRFSENEATLIEEGAGATPLMTWITRTLVEAARANIEAEPAAAPPRRHQTHRPNRTIKHRGGLPAHGE